MVFNLSLSRKAISATGKNTGVLLRDTGNEEHAMKPGICRVPYRSNLGLISVRDSQKHQPTASPGIAPWIRKKKHFCRSCHFCVMSGLVDVKTGGYEVDLETGKCGSRCFLFVLDSFEILELTSLHSVSHQKRTGHHGFCS